MKKYLLYVGLIALLPVAWWLGLHQRDHQISRSGQITNNLQTIVWRSTAESRGNLRIKLQQWQTTKFTLSGSEQSRIWQPTIDSIQLMVENLLGRIEQLKSDIKPQRRPSSNNTVTLPEEFQDQSILNCLKRHKNMALKLFDSLQVLAKTLGTIQQAETDPAQISLNAFIGPYNNRTLWENDYFGNISPLDAVSKLCLLQNVIVRSEKQVIERLIDPANSCLGGYRYHVLAVQNATHLLPGQTLEITAGIGDFTNQFQSSVTVDGHVQFLDEKGVATFTKKIGREKEGTIPVVIDFVDPNTGKRMRNYQNLHYTVEAL